MDLIIALNLYASIFYAVDLVTEFILIQLLNPDSEYSILSKHKIGIVEEGVRNSDSSESIESEISSSEDSDGNARASRNKSREGKEKELQVKEAFGKNTEFRPLS